MREEDGMRANIGTVRAFPGVTPDKAQALKVLEEAAEVFGTWQAWDEWRGEDDPAGRTIARSSYLGTLCEIGDCITACANLAAAMGVHDLRPYIERARAKNEERGRYAE